MSAPVTKPARTPIEEVMDLLDLEKIEENIFRGQSPEDRMQRVFGGQVLGQALVAASRTVEGRVCHSFHAYFLRAGDPKIPILYEVDRARDGASFTSRRVIAIQHGKQIFNMSASFQVPEKGLEHQFDMPKVPPPEQLVDEHEARKKWMENAPEDAKAWMSKPRPIEMRPVILDDWMNRKPREPFDNVWIRATGPVPDNVIVQQSVMAYASDMSLLDTALLPHGRSWQSPIQMASLDHAMWFHHPFKMDDWLLYAQDSPSGSGARGFNRGALYTRDGKLVASVVQEGLMRPREPRKA
ncbi:MAG: acyl-CoA thioesterase II [Alphaproteobacteria bacterium]|nr:acyl-CoA thioesterase II [Alphaproteobacteria bacterium]MBL6937517.1 acyl-CoA thioesterase II [Alphaproteobacteria bacterium]MBL7098855.1 acyl-CoA thioesterase II [Alphaproteobacteria bacterium]